MTSNLLSTELLSFYSKNIIFDSYNGSNYISGFDQRTTMNGIKTGEIKFTATPTITFDNNDVIFSSLNDDGVKIIWSIYDKQEWTTKAYISPIEGFSEKNSEIFLPEWVPSDGASSIWREGSQLIIFSGNSRYIFE